MIALSNRTVRQPVVRTAAVLVLVFLVLGSAAFAQKIDEAYTQKIRQYTTDPVFTTKYVNYLPAAPGIPTPADVLGHIVGAPDILSYSADVYKYFAALAKASPRIKVMTIGKTEEGRDWILAVISDAATIRNLDRYKQITAGLADPRKISETEARRLIGQGKPIYWATGGMHSSETGSVEMLMELAYRLVADESPFIKTIRDNSIVMITPILEPDGRDKYVDVAMAPRKDPQTTVTSRLLYWGRYVSHDNNRDNIGQALALTKNIMKVSLGFHPQVMHDLHESASHLYISTGSGPYNAWLDPIVIDEWHQMAYNEVDGMTREGVPGVWTHAFYDGWAPNYAFYAANGHNAIGRFYETQGAGDASTRIISAGGDRTWYRPNPPVGQLVWSIRDNVNLQQSALLIGLNNTAVNRERFLENFYLKSKRSVAKAKAEGPAAYIFPGNDPRPGQAARLLRMLQVQGVEIHKTDQALKLGDTSYPAGSHIVRMDQPYSRMADMLLDRQFYNTSDPRPYDDVGWTLGPLFNVKTVRTNDPAVLAAPMTLVQGEVRAPGGLVKTGSGPVQAYLINHAAENGMASFRFKNKDLKIQAAEKAFELEGRKFNAGTFVLKAADNAAGVESVLDAAGKAFGLTVAAGPLPDVPLHEVSVPRIALMHTWQNTQTEGWVRIALDEIGVPYDYISVHAARDNAKLRDKYDVILFGPSSGDALSLVNGVTGDKPQAWKKTTLTPNIGVEDSADDIRGGLELEGVLHLRDFVKDGGLFITLANTSVLPIHFGMAGGLSIRTTQNLWAQGSVFKAEVSDKTSPIVYGYDDSLSVYFSQGPVFGAGGMGAGARPMGAAMMPTGRPTGRGSLDDPDIAQGRPRDIAQKSLEEFRKAQKDAPPPAARAAAGPVALQRKTIMNFARDAKSLLISGGLAGAEELAGTPALVDAAVGRGHVIMFAFNPMWRHETHGSFALVTNAMLNHKNLSPAPVPAAPPAPPAPKK
jgi:hypothetical protein